MNSTTIRNNRVSFRIITFSMAMAILLLCSCSSKRKKREFGVNLTTAIDDYHNIIQNLHLTNYLIENNLISQRRYKENIDEIISKLDKVDMNIEYLRANSDDIHKGISQFYTYDYTDNYLSLIYEVHNGNLESAITAAKGCLESLYHSRTFFLYNPEAYQERANHLKD